MTRTTKIEELIDNVGGGWRLRLYEDGKDAGGGIFAPDKHPEAAHMADEFLTVHRPPHPEPVVPVTVNCDDLAWLRERASLATVLLEQITALIRLLDQDKAYSDTVEDARIVTDHARKVLSKPAPTATR